MKQRIITVLVAVSLVLASGCAGAAKEKSGKAKETKTVRIGYFPNITHSQAVIGMARGDFQKALGKNTKIDVKIFNAGPSAIEALFAGEIDFTYIGPNPAINGYVKSKGEALRIVAGATSGGAVFVVRKGSGIKSARDLAGKKLASPQLGNTQDVALRYYIEKAGFKTTEEGGNVEVIPTENSNILTLFLKKEIDGAWVPEPWGARLVKEGNGKILVEERELWPKGQFVTAHLIVRTDFLKENPDLVKRFLKAHVEETNWINSHLPQAKKILNSEIKRLTGKELPKDVLDDAFSRLTVTYDPIKSSLFVSADHAYKLGFLGEKRPDLKNIYDLKILNQVLREKNEKEIK